MRRALGLAALLALVACDDPHWDSEIEGARLDDAVVAERDAAQRAAALEPARPDKLVLFGDLHVHSSYSADGFLFTLPLVGGEGAHPPADACDFARHCAGLDFYALTDHAESLAPEHWEDGKQSVRQCNAIAAARGDPDLVAFMGFEWSQAGSTPEEHWGHRCVVFPDASERSLPARPIGATDNADGQEGLARLASSTRWLAPHDWPKHRRFAEHMRKLAARELCPEGVDSRQLPLGCNEVAPTPADLHRKLDEWGVEALSIPHGTAWGVYTPQGASIDKHLAAEQYDPERMRLIEVMSGHGNSEEFRPWASVALASEGDGEGDALCPEPTPDFLPCCWQAGEIMRKRCGDLPEEECERRVAQARAYAAGANAKPNLVFPDATEEDWLDCSQCRDCFRPAFNYRPRESVQYAMSLAQDPERRRFRYGFIGSSDGHSGRPGNGYKQVEPTMMADVRRQPDFPYSAATAIFAGGSMEDPQQPQEVGPTTTGVRGNDLRVASFLYPSGLAAVHAPARTQEAIWAALQRREVYGTSGPRILLWFDLLNASTAREGRAPMGSEHALAHTPRFEVRAVGSFEQKPGCSAESQGALSAERMQYLCRNECYHPSDRRRAIARIDIVRIRPQRSEDEPVAGLIEDPWRSFECAPDPAGCVVQFEDEEFVEGARDALYYARALEVPSPAINGGNMRTRFDAEGNPVSVSTCTLEDFAGEGCLEPIQQRAWSSPIFIDRASARGPDTDDDVELEVARYRSR